MGENTRLHDGIVGVLVTLGTVLAFYIDIYWLLLLGVVGLLLVQSAITGFCPVYYTLEKLRHTDTHDSHTGGALRH